MSYCILCIFKKTGLSSEEMRVAVARDYHDFYLLEKDTRTLKSEGIQKSVKVVLLQHILLIKGF